MDKESIVFSSGPITYEQAEEALMLCSSYSRLPSRMKMHSRLSDGEWLRLLGDWWSLCDNVGQFRNPLLAILAAAIGPYAK